MTESKRNGVETVRNKRKLCKKSFGILLFTAPQFLRCGQRRKDLLNPALRVTMQTVRGMKNAPCPNRETVSGKGQGAFLTTGRTTDRFLLLALEGYPFPEGVPFIVYSPAEFKAYSPYQSCLSFLFRAAICSISSSDNSKSNKSRFSWM